MYACMCVCMCGSDDALYVSELIQMFYHLPGDVYGFVNFDSDDSAEEATLVVNNHQVGDSSLKVSVASYVIPPSRKLILERTHVDGTQIMPPSLAALLRNSTEVSAVEIDDDFEDMVLEQELEKWRHTRDATVELRSMPILMCASTAALKPGQRRSELAVISPEEQQRRDEKRAKEEQERQRLEALAVQRAQEELSRKAEEEARLKAAQEAREKAEAQARELAQQRAAEELARKQAEEQAARERERLAQEAERKRLAEEEEKRRAQAAAAAAEAQRKLEEEAKRKQDEIDRAREKRRQEDEALKRQTIENYKVCETNNEEREREKGREIECKQERKEGTEIHSARILCIVRRVST
jgi:hypothetical protein